MKDECLIILDSSGSMKEEGKAAACDYLCRSVIGFIRDHYPETGYSVFRWSKQIAAYADSSIQDENSADATALLSFISEHKEEKIVLITDGNFSSGDRRKLSSLSDSGHIRILALGADANIPALRRFVGKERIFDAADSVECIRQMMLS